MLKVFMVIGLIAIFLFVVTLPYEEQMQDCKAELQIYKEINNELIKRIE